jgi:phospholipid N-methyltransferase
MDLYDSGIPAFPLLHAVPACRGRHPTGYSRSRRGRSRAYPTLVAQDLLFFRGFLRNWREVGFPVSSSRYLAKRVCRSINFASARTLLEIGAGTGIITREILASLHPEATLTVVETNSEFCDALRSFNDSRLMVHNISAFQMATAFRDKVQYVISGMPLATLSDEEFDRFQMVIQQILDPGGTFIQVQLAPLSYGRLKRSFAKVSVDFILLNTPPAFIYCCRNEEDVRIAASPTNAQFNTGKISGLLH